MPSPRVRSRPQWVGKRGNEACVTDGSHMGATIAKTHHRIFVQNHVATAVEIIFSVIGKRRVEHGLP